MAPSEMCQEREMDLGSQFVKGCNQDGNLRLNLQLNLINVSKYGETGEHFGFDPDSFYRIISSVSVFLFQFLKINIQSTRNKGDQGKTKQV